MLDMGFPLFLGGTIFCNLATTDSLFELDFLHSTRSVACHKSEDLQRFTSHEEETTPLGDVVIGGISAGIGVFLTTPPKYNWIPPKMEVW